MGNSAGIGLFCGGILAYITAIVTNHSYIAGIGLFGVYLGVRLIGDFLFKLGGRLYHEAKPILHRRYGASLLVKSRSPLHQSKINL